MNLLHPSNYPPRYEKPEPGDKRSPCSALNALANHGLINRNGKNIELHDVIEKVHLVYNVSSDLALVMAGASVLLCGNVKKLEVDLDKLALHNRIEHDYSLVHLDAAKGDDYAPTKANKALVDKLLNVNNVKDKEPKTYLTEKDFIQHRLNLVGSKNLKFDRVHKLVTSGEICMIMDVLGKMEIVTDKNGKPIKDCRGNVKKEVRVSKDFVSAWMYEERLPDKWARPSREIGFPSLSRTQKKYKKKAEELLDQQGNGTLRAHTIKHSMRSPDEFAEDLIKEIHGTTANSTVLPVILHTTISHRM